MPPSIDRFTRWIACAFAAVAARSAGAKTLYVAMFDEIDEGPQLFGIWYRFDTHGVTVAQDLGLGKR